MCYLGYGCTMCNACGKLDAIRDAAPKERRCFSCGTTVDDNAVTHCPSCGAMLPPAMPTAPGVKAAMNQRGQTPLIHETLG